MMKEYILRIDENADLNDLSIDDENIVWVNWHYPNGLGESTPEGTIRPYPSPWHTGTPTEEGWYLCAYGDNFYCANYWQGGTWKNQWGGTLLAYQKIEPFEEKS